MSNDREKKAEQFVTEIRSNKSLLTGLSIAALGLVGWQAQRIYTSRQQQAELQDDVLSHAIQTVLEESDEEGADLDTQSYKITSILMNHIQGSHSLNIRALAHELMKMRRSQNSLQEYRDKLVEYAPDLAGIEPAVMKRALGSAELMDRISSEKIRSEIRRMLVEKEYSVADVSPFDELQYTEVQDIAQEQWPLKTIREARHKNAKWLAVMHKREIVGYAAYRTISHIDTHDFEPTAFSYDDLNTFAADGISGNTIVVTSITKSPHVISTDPIVASILAFRDLGREYKADVIAPAMSRAAVRKSYNQGMTYEDAWNADQHTGEMDPWKAFFYPFTDRELGVNPEFMRIQIPTDDMFAFVMKQAIEKFKRKHDNSTDDEDIMQMLEELRSDFAENVFDHPASQVPLHKHEGQYEAIMPAGFMLLWDSQKQNTSKQPYKIYSHAGF